MFLLKVSEHETDGFNIMKDGTTPLSQASKEGHLELALLLGKIMIIRFHSLTVSILVKSGVNISKYHKHSLGTTPEFRQAIFGE